MTTAPLGIERTVGETACGKQLVGPVGLSLETREISDNLRALILAGLEQRVL